jgi:hypothetical protein
MFMLTVIRITDPYIHPNSSYKRNIKKYNSSDDA